MMLLLRGRVVRSLYQASILILGLFLSTYLVYAESEPIGEMRQIREIRFYISNLYSEEEAQKSSWSNFFNKYHITTREWVIRNELLFKKGDILDEELIAQSERKLRRFAFITDSQITVVPVDDQSVDVEVRTRDAWSLVPSLSFGGGGGLYTVSALLVESNLMGSGKKLIAEGFYQSDVGWTKKIGYRDYQLFNSKWQGSATYRTGPLIESYFAMAVKPLYSIDSKWSYGGVVSSTDKIVRRFEEGEESDRFASDQILLTSFVKRSFGERYQKVNAKFKLEYLGIDYSTLGSETTEPPPPDQANVTPYVSLSKQDNIQWEKFTYLNKMGSIEDTSLGLRYGGHVGYGIPVQDGFELWNVGASLSINRTFIHKQLLKTNIGVNSEVVRNKYLVAIAKYYKKFSMHTVATRFKVNLGDELDSSRQFTLGADSGLRGYPARQFTGESLMLINLEDRQFWGDYTFGPKIAVGTVLFVDTGNVWKEENEIDLNDLNWSTGLGLRLGLSNLPNQPILRIDVGWALGDQDGWAVTIGHEQQF